MKKKKGFTLIELLATIIILALVLSIGIYLALAIIRKTKENSYKVTINEIEKNANTYVIENTNRIKFRKSEDNSSIEQQCVSIQNLIDFGYLDNNVVNSSISETNKVLKTDYIYLERDFYSKAITKNIYVGNIDDEAEKNKYASICKKIVSGYGSIKFTSNPSLNEWSKEKTITITYTIKNLNDYNELINYEYKYTFDGKEINKNDNGDKKIITIGSNGTINASIEYGNKTFDSNSLIIEKIDDVGPVISLADNTTKEVSGSATIPLKVTDVGSGVDLDSFTKEDIVVKIGDNTIDTFTLTNKYDGNYDLILNDSVNKGKVTIEIDKGKVLDKVGNDNNKIELKTNITFKTVFTITYNGNGNTGGSTAQTTCNYNTDCPLRTNGFTKTGYTFDGWYAEASGSNKYGSTTKLTSNITVYAHWKINTYALDLNGLLDGSSSGNISGYGTADVYINGSLVSNDVTDYYNASVSYGTKYEIKDIKSTTGHTYNGVSSGSLSGTITGNTSVYLKFTTNTFWNDVNIYNPSGVQDFKSGYVRLSRDGVNWTGNLVNEDATTNGVPYGGKIYVKWIGPYYNYYELDRVTGANWDSATGSYVHTVTAANQSINFYTKYVSFTISYDTDGGTPCNPSTKQVKNGEKYGKLCRTYRGCDRWWCYSLIGWIAKGDNTFKIIDENTIVNLTENQVLEAYWSVRRPGGGGCDSMCVCASAGVWSC